MISIAKKIMAPVIALLMIIAVALQNANAATQSVFSYEVSDGQATIVNCDETAAGELIIPDTLGGFPVTNIGEYAFISCEGLTSVTIPDSVTSIGDEAFSFCERLTSITIPNSVKSIGDGVFSSCSVLNTVNIPESVSSIGFGVFDFCDRLTSIDVSEANKVYASENGVLFNKSKTDIICFPEGRMGSYTVPNSVKSIGNYVFYRCGLQSVTIPNGVLSIGEGAFSSCGGLTSITIPDSVESIGYDAFDATAWYGNQPDGLIYAGKVAYRFKGEIPANTAIVLKPGTKGIARGAFEIQGEHSDNPGLIGVSIPSSVTNIGKRAFFGCTGLKSVTIPQSVTSIGEYALGFYVFDEYPEIFPGFTINCFADSAGLKYAKENGFEYNILPASAATTDPTAPTTDPTENTSSTKTTTDPPETSTEQTETTSPVDSGSFGNRLTITVIIAASVAFLAVAATAVFITVKRKKKK